MTPAGTSNGLDVQNEWEENNTHMRIMQEGVFITSQEAMESVLNEALIDYESRLWFKAVEIKLSFPQQTVEVHEHVRDANQLGGRHDLHRRPRTTHKRLQEARS